MFFSPLGASICAWRALKWHVVVLEVDPTFLKVILALLEDSIKNTMSKEQPISSNVEMDDGDLVVQHVWEQC